jgi:hypothetical protein
MGFNSALKGLIVFYYLLLRVFSVYLSLYSMYMTMSITLHYITLQHSIFVCSLLSLWWETGCEKLHLYKNMTTLYPVINLV